MQKYNLFPEQLVFDYKNLLESLPFNDKSKLVFKVKALNSGKVNHHLLLETLLNYRKACHKLPNLTLHYCWLPTKSYEQSSSELTAFYKSSNFRGNKMLDLCGGLGVDDIAFANSFKEVVSLDTNEELNTIVRYNFQLLQLTNISRLNQSAETFLASNTDYFDMIYIDADRRPDSDAKKFVLEDCTPNIIELLPLIAKQGAVLLLKLSPLVDLSYLKTVLPYILSIQVVAVKNEVKEVLVTIDFKTTNPITIKAVNLIDKEQIQSFEFAMGEEMAVNKSIGEMNYFFEPNLAIIKAGLSAVYANYCGLEMLAVNSHFFIGSTVPDHFMGRIFKIITKMPFSKSAFKGYLKEKKLLQVNISKRNFPISVAEMYAQFKLKEGGNDYLFFSENAQHEKVMYHCERILS